MRGVIYSIIIPHHDIPDLLTRLLHSIPQREDTEIIIVDDNSSPEKVDFSCFPGLERSDVRVIFDKKGGYGGYARNLGIEKANGKWLLFADSDDYFNYCIGDILDEYSDASEDIVYFKSNSVDTDTYVQARRGSHLNRMIDLYEKNPYEASLELRYLFGEPWCKLVRKSMVEEHHIRFEERSIHNDTAFSYLVGYYARTVAVDYRALYCVTDREGSVSKEISESKKLERIENFGTSSQFFMEHQIPVRENRHFIQLYRCKNENQLTYEEGFSILLSLGFSRKEIQKGLAQARIEVAKGKFKAQVKRTLNSVFPDVMVTKG